MKKLLLAAFIVLCGSVAFAALPKLPGPLPLAPSPDSPGTVTFNHESHVDAGRPSCTTCHPKLFKILKRTARTPMTHERMNKGEQCGSCHGKTSFGFEDDCTMCHRS
ncbi:MAG TPA: c(7)-type cytochrome triheme domain-containing protein [Vicinamibacterales bacterium]|nr:c(7)-type cytochrome triheme domain-containing protein [Vicinamibacterales bacterium]